MLNRMMTSSKDTRYMIVDFIDRSFRDVADNDYVAARTCYRYELLDQFLWFGLQAIEKYLKAIILYNDGDTRKLGHKLNKAVKLVEKIPDVKWDFSDPIKEFLKYLTVYANDRYFTQPGGTRGDELQRLDSSVWMIRRYCQDLSCLKIDNQSKDYIDYLQSDECRKNPHQFRLRITGHLEDVLDSKKFTKQRDNLIWKNFYYGAHKKRKFRFSRKLSGKVPGHYFFPEIYPWVKERVKLEDKVIKHFENHIENPTKAQRTAGHVIIHDKSAVKQDADAKGSGQNNISIEF